MRRAVLIAAAFALLSAALAHAQSPAGRDCFYVSDVTSYRSGGPGVVYLSTADGRIRRLDTLNACRAALTSDRLAVVAPGTTRICRPVDAEIVVTDAVAGRRCPLRTIRTLSAQEAAQLPRAMRP